VNEAGDGSPKIKVVDRRRFDGQGELRPDRPFPKKKTAVDPQPKAAPALDDVPARPTETTDAGAPTSGVEGAATSPLFMDLVAGLAQQAEILITGGQGLPAQPAEAQRLIDYLSMLEGKTKGNLSLEEKQILSNVIFQLRSLYVQHSR